MLSDWLLTLFALGPAFLALLIVLLALLGHVARHEPDRSMLTAQPRHDGESQ